MVSYCGFDSIMYTSGVIYATVAAETVGTAQIDDSTNELELKPM